MISRYLKKSGFFAVELHDSLVLEYESDLFLTWYYLQADISGNR